MTRQEAMKKLQAVKVYMTSGNPIWSVTEMGEAFDMAIKALEEPHWISVSERLPEYGVSVLTYDGHCFCVEKRIPTIRDNEGEPIIGDWWVSDDYDEYDSDYYPNLRDGACIAWMPLPEPWRGDEE